MSKINKEIAVFIVFLTLLTIYRLWNVPIIDAIMHYSDVKVGGLVIEFKNGTTEPEVKYILENCNMTVNFTIDYNTPDFRDDKPSDGEIRHLLYSSWR